MRLTEEMLLLLLDEKTGGLEPIQPWALAYALSGATLMDLSILDRIDTDAQQLTVIDATPTNDTLLDCALAEIANAGDAYSTRWWLDRFAERAEEIRETSLEALTSRGILAAREDSFLEFVVPGAGTRVRNSPSVANTAEQEVRLRIMRCLLGNDIPDPKDVMIIGLAEACGIFSRILTQLELDALQPRIALVSRMDHIGRAVSGAIWEVEPPTRKRPVRFAKPIPEARGLPILGNGVAMVRDMREFILRQYKLLGPVFRIRAPGRRYTVMAGIEANRFLNRHGKTYFRSDQVWHGFAHALGAGRMMPSMDGAEHFKLRRAQRNGMARKVLENRVTDAVRIARREVHHWGASPVPVLHAMQRIVTEQLGTILTGTSPREYIDDLIVFFRTLLQVEITGQSPAWWLWTPRFRHAVNSFEFEGYSIAAGEQVMVATAVPHFLPEFFPDPYRFDIDRYTESQEQHKQPGVFAPFGLGTHRCLGSSFAEWQMALTMLTILHTVELEMHPSGYRLRIKQTPTNRPNDRFCLRVVEKRS